MFVTNFHQRASYFKDGKFIWLREELSIFLIDLPSMWESKKKPHRNREEIGGCQGLEEIERGW